MAALLVAATVTHAAGDGWLTNFDMALAAAKEQNRHVLVEFHGSDWCPPCIKLQKEVLATDAFKTFAADRLVLVDIDFPRRTPLADAQRAHNSALAERYGIEGLPTVILLSPKGEIVARSVGFPEGGLKGFIDFLKRHTGS
jgi:protein disulfide-isomerase